MYEEGAVLLTDACPTGYFDAQLGEIREGDVVVVFGAGPVGLFVAKSSWLMGCRTRDRGGRKRHQGTSFLRMKPTSARWSTTSVPASVLRPPPRDSQEREAA
jgi:hypothetical protein